jgi:hypothetical protein
MLQINTHVVSTCAENLKDRSGWASSKLLWGQEMGTLKHGGFFQLCDAAGQTVWVTDWTVFAASQAFLCCTEVSNDYRLFKKKGKKGIKQDAPREDVTILFYYESRKREFKTRLIYEDRCDERLKN